MAAPFNDPAVFQNDDKVGVPYSRETVGDDQAGASLHQLVETLLDKDFATGVDVASRFIQ